MSRFYFPPRPYAFSVNPIANRATMAAILFATAIAIVAKTPLGTEDRREGQPTVSLMQQTLTFNLSLVTFLPLPLSPFVTKSPKALILNSFATPLLRAFALSFSQHSALYTQH
jgi:hypothetical protein